RSPRPPRGAPSRRPAPSAGRAAWSGSTGSRTSADPMEEPRRFQVSGGSGRSGATGSTALDAGLALGLALALGLGLGPGLGRGLAGGPGPGGGGIEAAVAHA